MKAKDIKRINSHRHWMVPITLWGHQGSRDYSMEIACVCGAFKIIDAMQVEDEEVMKK